MSIFSNLFNCRFILFFVAHHRPYRMAALATLSVLIGWGASHTIQSSYHSNRLASAVDQYGVNISALVSDQLAHSVSQSDSISAQATAQNIVRKAAVSSIIIYDNNNQILAQAIGLENSDHSTIKKYTSPILSGENIIGSTTVTIKSGSFNTATQTAPGLWWAVGLISLSLVFFIKDILSTQQKPIITNHLASRLESSKDKNNKTEDITENSKTDTTVIYAIITIHNIDTLHQQLSSELRQRQILLLEKNISHAINLYGGEKLVIDNNKMVLVFDKRNIENAVYNLQLLLALHKKNKQSMITMSGLIMESGKSKTQAPTFSQLKSLANNKKTYGLYIQTDIIEKYNLDSHLQYTKENDSFATIIDGLQPHYQQLLDNQLTHLLSNKKT